MNESSSAFVFFANYQSSRSLQEMGGTSSTLSTSQEQSCARLLSGSSDTLSSPTASLLLARALAFFSPLPGVDRTQQRCLLSKNDLRIQKFFWENNPPPSGTLCARDRAKFACPFAMPCPTSTISWLRHCARFGHACAWKEPGYEASIKVHPLTTFYSVHFN